MQRVKLEVFWQSIRYRIDVEFESGQCHHGKMDMSLSGVHVEDSN